MRRRRREAERRHAEEVESEALAAKLQSEADGSSDATCDAAAPGNQQEAWPKLARSHDDVVAGEPPARSERASWASRLTNGRDERPKSGGESPQAPSPYRLSLLQPDGSLASPPVRGLCNLGNSCYLNCVLQVLGATGGVREHFVVGAGIGGASDEEHGRVRGQRGRGRGGRGRGRGHGRERMLSAALRDFFRDVHSTGPAEEPVKPAGLLQAVSALHSRYARRAQQDAHEMLRQLLEGLRIEMSGGTASGAMGGGAVGADGAARGDTLIDELFGGETRSTVVCLSCGHVSCSHEPFLDLSLPIPRKAERAAAVAPSNGVAAGSVGVLAKPPSELTAPHEQLHLASCLQAYCAPEALRGDNAYACGVCETAAKARAAKAGGAAATPLTRQPALRWLQLSSVPRFLTLHLKRFYSVDGEMCKLDEHVPFPETLDLDAFTCAAAAPPTHVAQLGGGGTRATMRLYALVEHQGSFSGGHYIAYVRLGEVWYRMSDSRVTEVSEAEVLGVRAFMLFYT